ncbi:MAG: hypothetical protein KF795_02425 [Labilithrix sp.]|nr:hypothetical protein [Labilithrix sp.]
MTRSSLGSDDARRRAGGRRARATRSRGALLGSLVFAALAALSLGAGAEPVDRAGAKEAYDRGVEAHKRGELHDAAEEFARADALAPSAVALQAALDAAIEADDASLGAALLERSKRGPAPPALASSITAAHLKFRGRAGRVRVLCPEGSTCSARLDDKVVDVDRVVWTSTGKHTLRVDLDGNAQAKAVDVSSDQILDVTPNKGAPPSIVLLSPSELVERPSDARPTAPATESDEAEASGGSRAPAGVGPGLPPVVFFGGVALTVALAGVTTWFALDASSTHGAFEKAGCGTANFAACEGLKDDGEGSQRATNIALALTAVSGIATALVGVMFTSWGGPAVVVHPSGGAASWQARF